MNPYLIIALIFLILLIGIIIALIYFFRHLSLGKGTSCSNNYQCLADQVCKDQTCQSQLCTRNTDCQTNQECVFGVCVTQNCNGANTCMNGDNQVCIPSTTGDFCAFLPPNCNSDQDCYAGTLGCTNGKCIQCQSNRDCLDGQTCNGQGVCVTSCTASSCASGNICVHDSCCPSSGLTLCTNTSQCSGDTPYCVSGACTCIPGAPLDPCTTNADCVSGSQCIADTQGNNVCSFQGGTACLYNNSSGSSQSFPFCPNDTPFCVNGTCSVGSIGSLCTADSNCGGYCVNGVCSATAGWFGDGCATTPDCSYISGSSTEQQSFQCVGGICI